MTRADATGGEKKCGVCGTSWTAPVNYCPQCGPADLLDIVKRLGVYLPAELQGEVDAAIAKAEAASTDVQQQMHFMARQAELLDEQGNDVSARVMRDCMKVLALVARERDQQTNFKYKANLRADRAEARPSARVALDRPRIDAALALTAWADAKPDLLAHRPGRTMGAPDNISYQLRELRTLLRAATDGGTEKS